MFIYLRLISFNINPEDQFRTPVKHIFVNTPLRVAVPRGRVLLLSLPRVHLV